MNYLPAVAWGLCPGGTATQVANYFGSWGLLGDLPEGAGTETITYYRIPTVPRHPIIHTVG
jgi:hypothetical protein